MLKKVFDMWKFISLSIRSKNVAVDAVTSLTTSHPSIAFLSNSWWKAKNKNKNKNETSWICCTRLLRKGAHKTVTLLSRLILGRAYLDSEAFCHHHHFIKQLRWKSKQTNTLKKVFHSVWKEGGFRQAERMNLPNWKLSTLGGSGAFCIIPLNDADMRENERNK